MDGTPTCLIGLGHVFDNVNDHESWSLDTASKQSSKYPCQGRITSGESRIIFLPERSSICQYPCKISTINVKKQSRAHLLLTHPVLYILKIQKTVRCILKTTISKSTKKRQAIGYVRQLALSLKVVQAMQLELSKFNTSYYMLILYLQFTYPKKANLIQILYIVCRALGCFKGALVKSLMLDVIQISTRRRTGFK